MTTARQIITSALTTGLNRLSAGEALDADLAALCLSALNDVLDDINGSHGVLWKQPFTDLDTNYTMGDGWRTILAALLAQKVARAVVGGVPPDVAHEAAAARRRLLTRISPAIINPGPGGDAMSEFFRGA